MNNQISIQHNVESPKQAIMAALSSTPIHSCNFQDFAVAISAAVEQAIFYLGLNKTDEDRDLLKMAAVRDCQTTFKMLTIAEVELALQCGVRGQYGEVRGMAPKDIYHWLNSYQIDDVRLKVKKQLAEKDKFKHEPTDEELIELAQYNLNNAWVKFKTDGSFYDHANIVYNILDRNNKLTFTKEEKNQFLVLAKAQLLSYHDPLKHIGDDIKMKEALKIHDAIKGNDLHIRTVAEAKRIAVNKYFQRLVDAKIELWDLFKDNEAPR